MNNDKFGCLVLATGPDGLITANAHGAPELIASALLVERLKGSEVGRVIDLVIKAQNTFEPIKR